MTQRPNFERAARLLKCEEEAIAAVFQVEAAGRFFEADGSLPQRFEPHKFPREHWLTLGFDPGQAQPWRASLRLPAEARLAMFRIAQAISPEAAYRATSWGAPQIMGFNHTPAGFGSAEAMRAAFAESADAQIEAFARLCKAWKLDSAIRSRDWQTFARAYNGEGQAEKYAARIEAAYRKLAGRASPVVLRRGSSGPAVADLQRKLAAEGHAVEADGRFGPATDRAVREYQAAHGLTADGVVGAVTWREIAGSTSFTPRAQPETAEVNVASAFSAAGPYLGGGGAATAVSALGDNAQTILIAGIVVVAVVLAGAWAFFKLRRAFQ